MHPNYLLTYFVKNILKILLPLLTVLMLTACSSTATQIPSNTVTWPLSKEQTWQLTSLNGRSIPDDSKATTLSFNPEAGIFRGQTACNFFAGAYTLGNIASDGRYPLSIDFLGSGSIQCPEADMNAEERFLATIKKASAILICEHTLSIYQNDKEILHFELQDF